MKKFLLILGFFILIVITGTFIYIKKNVNYKFGAEQVESENGNKPVVSIDGTVFTINGVSYDVTKEEVQINLIVGYQYINDYNFILYCHINPRTTCYLVFDTEKMDYTYKFYGGSIAWYDNNVNSIIYAQNDVIYNIDEKNIYTVKLTATQYIYDLEHFNNGKTVIVTIRDSDADDKKDLVKISFDYNWAFPDVPNEK